MPGMAKGMRSLACKSSTLQQSKNRTVHNVNDDSEEDDYFCYVESVGSVSDSVHKNKIFATFAKGQLPIRLWGDSKYHSS